MKRHSSPVGYEPTTPANPALAPIVSEILDQQLSGHDLCLAGD